MKKQLLSAIVMIFAYSAQAEYAEVRTNFWKMQVPQKLNAKLSVGSNDLEKNCSDFAKLSNLSKLHPENYERFRKMPRSAWEMEFQQEFKIPAGDLQKLLQQKINAVRVSTPAYHVQAGLPFYNAKLGQMDVDLLSAELVHVNTKANSFAELASKLNLEPSEVRVKEKSGEIYLVTYGRDVACDLYLSQVDVVLDIPVIAAVDSQYYTQISRLYSDIENIVEQFVSKRRSTFGKIAVFGYKASEVLAEQKQSIPVLLSWVENVGQLLFDEKMNKSPVWTSVGSKQIINVPPSIRTEMKVELRGVK